jgi:hypothetical protein
LRARSFFAYLQSAAMGGYGAASVALVTRGLAMTLSAGDYCGPRLVGMELLLGSAASKLKTFHIVDRILLGFTSKCCK